MNKKLISKPFQLIGAFFAYLFGRPNWSSPPWLRSTRRMAVNKPGLFWASLVSLLLLAGFSLYSYQWYKSQPKPRLITADISAPRITPLEDELTPDDLVIDFGYPGEEEFNPQSVAPLDKIGKPVTAGIELSPAIPGEWIWESDSRLVFTPHEDWPAGQQYEIKFAKDVFAKQTKMESYTYSFKTKPFEAKIAEFTFYQDPVNAQNRKAVATIQFNFPVDPTSLQEHIQLNWQAASGDANTENTAFNVTYDQFKRTAYIHSENLALPKTSKYLRLTLDEGIKAATGNSKTDKNLSQNLLIPDASNYFKISRTNANIIRNERDKPEQILTIETSLGVTDKALNKALHVYLLPENYPATVNQPGQENYTWQNPGEVNATILALSTPLTLQALPADRNYATLHSYKFNTKTPRFMYVKIDKGIQGFGDFTLTQDYAAVIPVPELPKEISFLHKGALLALSGEQKLSVTVRGVPAVKFSFARVLPDSVNHLVTQTQGDFNNPYFINQSFNEQNISEIFSEIQQFNADDLSKQQYTALDLAKYLGNQADAGGPQGLFLIQATGWDVNQDSALDVKTSRLVLVTDLALIVKDNNDGTHQVFVQSISQGIPAPNVTVTLLGKNGLPLLSRVTDSWGQAAFPVLTDFVDEREPTVYLAKYNNDVSFIPYNNSNRQLNYSRFDVGGVYHNSQDQHRLSAYLFSDRGLYRPGDTIHIGSIVKQVFAQGQAAGLPLQLIVNDPRGNTILDKKFALNETGFETFDLATQASSPTGQYQISLYISKDNRPDSLLGNTTVRVAEFQPDRMRIKANLLPANPIGWISPVDLKAQVDLVNLYGAPAVNRKVSAKVILNPQAVQFSKYPDYVFVDPLIDSTKPNKVFTDTLPDGKTDANGQAQFNLNLERFDKATYELTFTAEGFEAEGGRSVVAQTKALVSPLEYFVGYKADGDLNYIKQNSQRTVNWIAVNPQLTQQNLTGLRIQLSALQPVTTLVKTANDTYQYQSITKTTVLSTQPFSIDGQGVNYPLSTDQIGNFSVQILDKNNTVLSQLKYTVVGASQQPLAKNAELSVLLNKQEYKAGEEVELQITAPYTGSGLITIERDKVYAAKWFKTDTTSSIQTITIPADFQGNGYINVAFVRNWDSPEIFISPLSYRVVPFMVNHENHDLQIHLNTPELARPGELLTIDYTTNKPGKIVVFAVDEGILQVANYSTPDPLAFFFQKQALQVLTQQTVDQILPRYLRERELSAVGGDDGEELLANHLNPFKRKADLPVVYWSGIIDADTTTRQVTYQIPDYFNGTLTVIAVGVSENEVGAAKTEAKVRGNFIINPNAPTFVAPGDEFEMSASIANNVENSGANAQVTVNLNVPPELEIIGSSEQTLTIAEGQEQTVRYKLRAKAEPGSATLTLVANANGKASSMNASLSIRPASTLMTTIQSGGTKEPKQTLRLDRSLYPDYRQVELALSNNPLILLTGLQRYLDNFPYGCTEQLTSKALPLLSMFKQPRFNKEQQTINEKIAATIQALTQRQMSNGGFSYWPGVGDNYSNDFATVYAMHFLTEARAIGYPIANDLFYNGLNYLKDLAAQNNNQDLDKIRIQAYAIYILTRNEIVTSNYLGNLQQNLDGNKAINWQQDITSAYMAATYQMLKNQTEAEKLIGLYKITVKPSLTNDFYNYSIANAQYLYLIAMHFPKRLASAGNQLIMPLVEAMNSDEINTLFAGYTSMALNAYGQSQQQQLPNTGMSVTETLANNQQQTIDLTDLFTTLAIAPEVKQLLIHNPDKLNYFYQFVQSGFDIGKPAPMEQGIEISREYRVNGQTVSTAALGQEIEVHIQVRALNDRYLNNIAIVDLLPGGFEVVNDSVSRDKVDYADVREDRVIFFTSLTPNAQELVYRIKATNGGHYQVPPILAEAMYDPALKAVSEGGEFQIVPSK